MNILHIISGLNDGGAEGILFRLCCHDKNNQHTIISLTDEGKYGPLLHNTGVAVHCLRMPRGRVTATGIFRLWRLFREQQPNAVQTWMYHADLLGGLVARLAGCRNVVWNIRHSSLESGKSKGSTIMVAKVCARLSKWIPTRIVVCAEQAARVHADLGYATGKMVVIANGYDISHLQPNNLLGLERRAEWGIAGRTPIIGMVARFNPQKDHANLLAALVLLKDRGDDFSCVLVGTGIETANEVLAQLISESGLDENVRLLGRRNDIPAIMNALDLHVLSSSFGEAFPNVLAEAMACGTPCVTTDVGDAALIVGDTGWVVPPRSPEALAEAIAGALVARKDSMAWQQRQDACRARIEEMFSVERMVEAYNRVWSEDRL